jgi:hypothetical protein
LVLRKLTDVSEEHTGSFSWAKEYAKQNIGGKQSRMIT